MRPSRDLPSVSVCISVLLSGCLDEASLKPFLIKIMKELTFYSFNISTGKSATDLLFFSLLLIYSLLKNCEFISEIDIETLRKDCLILRLT